MGTDLQKKKKIGTGSYITSKTETDLFLYSLTKLVKKLTQTDKIKF